MWQPVTSGDSPWQPVTSGNSPRQPVTSGDSPRQPVTSGNSPRQPVTSGDNPRQPVTSGDSPRQPVTSGDSPRQPITSGDSPRQPVTSGEVHAMLQSKCINCLEEWSTWMYSRSERSLDIALAYAPLVASWTYYIIPVPTGVLLSEKLKITFARYGVAGR